MPTELLQIFTIGSDGKECTKNTYVTHKTWHEVINDLIGCCKSKLNNVLLFDIEITPNFIEITVRRSNKTIYGTIRYERLTETNPDLPHEVQS